MFQVIEPTRRQEADRESSDANRRPDDRIGERGGADAVGTDRTEDVTEHQRFHDEQRVQGDRDGDEDGEQRAALGCRVGSRERPRTLAVGGESDIV